MKTYKALVRDPYDNGRRSFIEDDFKTKKAFVEHLRGNGYQVTYVKEKELFDWCLDKADYANDEDSHFAVWQFTKIPETEEEFKELLEKYKDRYWDRKVHRAIYYNHHREEISEKNKIKRKVKKMIEASKIK